MRLFPLSPPALSWDQECPFLLTAEIACAGLSVMAALLSVNRREDVTNQDEVVKCRRRWSLKGLAVVCLCSCVCMSV